jgi:hypothetical protein
VSSSPSRKLGSCYPVAMNGRLHGMIRFEGSPIFARNDPACLKSRKVKPSN